MLDDSLFEEIKKRSQESFRHSHHDKMHVERVYSLAVRIAKEENSGLDVIKAAALLHDIARAAEDDDEIVDHAIEGAKIAENILKEVDFPKEKIAKGMNCVRNYRFKNSLTAESIEAKILQDADRLDVIGAIGIARTFARGGWNNMSSRSVVSAKRRV